jgi:hypothetical protein
MPPLLMTASAFSAALLRSITSVCEARKRWNLTLGHHFFKLAHRGDMLVRKR